MDVVFLDARHNALPKGKRDGMAVRCDKHVGSPALVFPPTKRRHAPRWRTKPFLPLPRYFLCLPPPSLARCATTPDLDLSMCSRLDETPL